MTTEQRPGESLAVAQAREIIENLFVEPAGSERLTRGIIHASQAVNKGSENLLSKGVNLIIKHPVEVGVGAILFAAAFKRSLILAALGGAGAFYLLKKHPEG